MIESTSVQRVTNSFITPIKSAPDCHFIILNHKRYRCSARAKLLKNTGIINRNRNNSASCIDNKRIVNWKAQIQNINSRETVKSIALSFELEYAPEQYRKVTFDVDYILPQDSINTDKIYQAIRSLNNYSTVYFDGLIRKKANGEAHYSSYSDDFMHSYPDFKFFVVDNNTTSKGDTLSNNLQNAVDLSFQAIEPLELNFKKEISKKESSKRVEKIAPRFKAAKEVLTQDERKRISID